VKRELRATTQAAIASVEIYFDREKIREAAEQHRLILSRLSWLLPSLVNN
jgi:hypothetical protein